MKIIITSKDIITITIITIVVVLTLGTIAARADEAIGLALSAPQKSCRTFVVTSTTHESAASTGKPAANSKRQRTTTYKICEKTDQAAKGGK